MSSFGETLRNAREAKGLTCSQVAAQTHMLVQIVEEMEREDFHRIPAPIYGRGFVRLFADCVGLDPVPLVREFMDIYEGRRTPAVSVREVPVAPFPPPAQPAWTPAPTPQPVPAEPAPEPEPPPEQAYEPIPPPVPADEPEPPVQTEVFPEPAALRDPEPAAQLPEDPEPAVQPPEEPEPAVQPPEEPEPATQLPEEPEPAVQPPEPAPEMSRDVQGLELFEQAPARAFADDRPLFGPASTPAQGPAPKSPAGLPPQIDFDSSRFLTSNDFEDGAPTAAARFRKGLSEISSSIVKTVRNIPRRVWRMTALVLCAVLGIVFIVWSVGKLYKATSAPDKAGSAEAEAVQAPAAEQPAPAEGDPAPSAPKAKPAPSSAKPDQLISTGQDIPNLIRN